MRVSDIFLQAQDVTGVADEATNFDRLSDAVETLANKGLVDAMQGYLEVPVTSSRIVTLPRDVEVPVKVNIGNNPAFSRTKLYEFTMNGPGNDYTPTDWAWEDKGEVSVLVQPTSATTVRVVSSNAGDVTSKNVYIWGRIAAVAPNTIGQEVNETLTLTGTSQVTSTNVYASITRIIKDVTLGTVTLSTSGGTTLSIYAPTETEPAYRQIKLSQSGTTAHILFRRSVFRISTQNDWIPIQSRMGLYLMLRANQFYRLATPADIQTAQALEKQAEQFVAEEQKSRNIFAEVASQTEKDSCRGLNINNRDSIIVSDIYDDACEICGPIGKQKIFDRITDAVDLLQNKGQWDGNEGYVDISTFDSDIVTLPRYVDYVMAVNIGCRPAVMRNRWFEFHLNGPGSECSQSCSWTDMNQVVTIEDLTEAQGLIYKPDSSADNDKTLRVFGYDEDDKWITEDGEDGFELTGLSSASFADISSQKVKRIERITREATAGYAQLIAYNEDGDDATQLGYYWPDETEPNYRRLKIPCNACYVRMRYRKKHKKISALTDPIHLKSKLAILAALSSIQAMRSAKPDLQVSTAFEMKAVQLLSEEKLTKNPADSPSLQFAPGVMTSCEFDQY